MDVLIEDKNIAIGSDHRGYGLKIKIIEYLQNLGYKLKDFGCFSEESVDYPDFAFKVAADVAEGKFSRGILICGSGIGMSMAGNRIKGARSALCRTEFDAKMARNHNNANILALGADVSEEKTVLKIVETFLTEEFEGGRHQRRVNKMDEF